MIRLMICIRLMEHKDRQVFRAYWTGAFREALTAFLPSGLVWPMQQSIGLDIDRNTSLPARYGMQEVFDAVMELFRDSEEALEAVA